MRKEKREEKKEKEKKKKKEKKRKKRGGGHSGASRVLWPIKELPPPLPIFTLRLAGAPWSAGQTKRKNREGRG